MRFSKQDMDIQLALGTIKSFAVWFEHGFNMVHNTPCPIITHMPIHTHTWKGLDYLMTRAIYRSRRVFGGGDCKFTRENVFKIEIHFANNTREIIYGTEKFG